jgi:hypothetical protein
MKNNFLQINNRWYELFLTSSRFLLTHFSGIKGGEKMNESKKFLIRLGIPIASAAIITAVAAVIGERWGFLFIGIILGILIGTLIKTE